MFFYTLLALALPLVHALPVIDDDVRVRRALGTGANNSSENSASAKIIVPVVLAAVIFLMLLIVGWWRRRKRLRQVVSNIRNNASATNTSTPAAARTTRTTRTETSTRTPITAPGTGPDAPPRPPRRRRRRRPSQISTKSLPAYNEQAGDEEIVLVRRVERDSMSDEDDDDDDDENPRNSRSVREHARSASETPLLDDASPEMGRASLPSSTRGRSEGGHDEQESHDTHARPEHSNDTSVSFTTTADPTNEPAAPPPNVPEVNPTTTTIPIGDAPPYAEAIRASQDGPGLEQNQHSDVGAVPSTSTNASSPGEADALGTLRPKRRSVFRQFFAINRPGSTSTAVSDSVEMAPTEPRQSLSAPSATNIPATQGAQTRHRPSASISTLASSSRGHGHTLSPSLSSLLLTRSRSPTRSSDSLAQRYNISAPIPTTLLRTELSYPRSGPTPEQIRFLSSRESLGRFGMPYGEEAVAAAALSRENISSLVSPPEYAPAPNATSETQNATITPNSRRARLGSSSLSQVPTIVTTSDTGSESLPEGARTPSPPRAASPSPESIETANQNAPLDESTMRAHTPDQPDRSNQAADSVMPANDRRDSMFSTNSFVTADEGDRDTLAEAREKADSDSDTSPPTPTVETYRQADDTIQATQSTDHQADVVRQRPRGQTILVPGSNTGDEVPHPELSFIPATPTVDGPIRVDDGA